jgi:hypothetical protein
VNDFAFFSLKFRYFRSESPALHDKLSLYVKKLKHNFEVLSLAYSVLLTKLWDPWGLHMRLQVSLLPALQTLQLH